MAIGKTRAAPRQDKSAARSLFTGRPLPSGQDLPIVSPLFLLLEGSTFFLLLPKEPPKQEAPAGATASGA